MAGGRSGANDQEDLSSRETRSLLFYVGAYSVSVLGDRFGELALPLVVLAATRDPAAAGAVGAGVQAPSLLLALWLGRWVDRHSRRALMLTADLLRAVCFSLFAWLTVGHVAGVWPFVLVGLFVGSSNALFAIAGSAILPQIVKGKRLARANALTEAGDALMTVSGPAAAGVVIHQFGAAIALAADAVSFLLSALLLLRIRLSSPRRADTGPIGDGSATDLTTSPRLRGLVEPLGTVFRDPTQRVIQVGLTALNAHSAGIVLAIILLAGSQLHLSTPRLGMVLAAAGVGGLLVSLAAARWTGPFSRVTGVGLMLWLSAALVAVLALATGFWWALVANGLVDGAITAGFIVTATSRQQHTPVSALGRVTAASVVCNGATRFVGIGGAGLLLAAFGARTKLLVDALLLAAAGMYITRAAGSRRTDRSAVSPGS